MQQEPALSNVETKEFSAFRSSEKKNPTPKLFPFPYFLPFFFPTVTVLFFLGCFFPFPFPVLALSV